MPRPPAKHPTELELEILKILWRDGARTVRQVREALEPGRKLAHTSVMTILGIMADKGYVTRKEQPTGHIYSARITERKTLRRMLGDLVERAFDGSAFDAMSHLLDAAELDDEELKRLRQMLLDKSREIKR
jgi:predicted transcriptional regulator